ncbi:MAG: sialidase family protein [Pseudomonadota bacterium]|nr:sialidase family protein [Pseudomonadota bacterium]
MTLNRHIFWLNIVIILCCLWQESSGEECQQHAPQYLDKEQKITLYFDDITTLPENIVFLGGYYHDGANTFHPALFISRDGGQTWKENQILCAGSSIQNFQTYGKLNIWAIMTLRQEGTQTAQYLISSTDAGNNWQLQALNTLDTLHHISEFRFFDAHHGIINFSSAAPAQVNHTYYTQDGGKTWQSLWKIQPKSVIEIERDYRYPEFTEPPHHTPLWRKEFDLYKIVSVLRFRQQQAEYLIETYDYSGTQVWKPIATIPRYYRFEENKLNSIQ